MSQVSITVTFPTLAAAAAFLMAANAAGNVAITAAPTPVPAVTPPSAVAAPVAAPAPVAQATPLTFAGNVLPALQAYAGKVPRETFAALMAKYQVTKVPQLEAKPETWAEIIATCSAV